MVGEGSEGPQARRGSRLVQGVVTSRWLQGFGAIFFAILAVVNAERGAWVLFGLTVLFSLLGAAFFASPLLIRSKERAFNDASAASTASTRLTAGKAGIIVRRPPTARGIGVRYMLWIDGAEVGAVKFGAISAFEVQPGPHRVFVGVGHYRPPSPREWAVELAAGEAAEFLCESESPGRVSLRPANR